MKAERVGKGPAGGEGAWEGNGACSEQRIKIQVDAHAIIKPIIVYVNKILILEKPFYRYHSFSIVLKCYSKSNMVMKGETLQGNCPKLNQDAVANKKIYIYNAIILHKNCGQRLSTLYHRSVFLFKDKISLCGSSWPWSQKFFCPCFPRDRITVVCQRAWHARCLNFIVRYYPQPSICHRGNWAHQTRRCKLGCTVTERYT